MCWATQLGIVDESKGSFAVDYKWIYWSNNKYGNALVNILDKLVEIGFLEYGDDRYKIRTNRNFNLTKSNS